MSDSGAASKIRLKFRWAAALLLVAVSAVPAQAAVESGQRIEQIAEAFLQARAGEAFGDQATVTLQPLDRRLSLKRCSQAPYAFAPDAARLHGATSVGVRCDGDSPWTVYVRARVQVWQKVVVSTRPLPRGARLDSADLALKRVDVSALSGGYLDRIDAAVDLELKRAIGPAVVLTRSMMGAPVAIRRGETVTLVSAAGNLRVAVSGRALSDGAVGARIRVQNLASGRRLEGVVEGPGVVSMSPGSQPHALVTNSVTR